MTRNGEYGINKQSVYNQKVRYKKSGSIDNICFNYVFYFHYLQQIETYNQILLIHILFFFLIQSL